MLRARHEVVDRGELLLHDDPALDNHEQLDVRRVVGEGTHRVGVSGLLMLPVVTVLMTPVTRFTPATPPPRHRMSGRRTQACTVAPVKSRSETTPTVNQSAWAC